MDSQTKKRSKIALLAVGDVFLGDSHFMVGRGVGSSLKAFGIDHPFERIQSVFAEAELKFGNLECPISRRQKRRLMERAFLASPLALDSLKVADFQVVSVANNHMMDHGVLTARETVELLSNRGIASVGFTDGEHQCRPLFVEKNGLKLGFLAYTFTSNSQAGSVFEIATRESILSDLQKAGGQVDRCIISLHWGFEYMEEPSQEQVRLAHELIDAGADLILGHHPHTPQPIEIYNNGVIVYSLGNFIFDVTFTESMRRGFIFRCDLSKKGIENPQAIPIRINNDHQAETIGSEYFAGGISNPMRLNLSTEDYAREATRRRKQESRQIKVFFLRNLFRMRWQPVLLILLLKIEKIIRKRVIKG